MDGFFIYSYNVSNSSEFYNLDQLYQFLLKGQDIYWEKWWEYAKNLSTREVLKRQRMAESYLNGGINYKLFRPAVNKNGLILGNPLSFLKSFYLGEIDYFDIVD